MAIDYAPEFGTKFTLTGPDGTIATFNDTADPNDVGVLTNITGLDSAEVREAGDSLVEFDGGVQGPGYYGRRPVVLEGLVYGHGSAEARAAKLARLHKAANAMRGDSVLSWTPSVTGGVPVYLTLRKHQPLRVDGAWNKNFQAGMIAADPRIYTETTNTSISTLLTSATLAPINNGNAESYPVYKLVGAITNPSIINYPPDGSDARSLNITTPGALGNESVLVFDTLARTIMLVPRKMATRTNLDVNPSFEAGTSAWTHSGEVTTAIVTEAVGYQQYGTKALRVTRASGATPTTSIIKRFTGISAGQMVTVGFNHRSPSTQVGKVSIVLIFYTAGSVQVGSPLSIPVTDPSAYTTNDWKRWTGYGLIPATATQVDVIIQYAPVNHTALATDYNVDAITVEHANGPAGMDYFDGSNPLPDYSTVWSGTTDDSTSVATLTDPTATSLYTPFIQTVYSWLNFSTSAWAGLQAGTNNITVAGTSIGATAALRINWRDAWL